MGKRPELALRGMGLPEPSPRTAQADPYSKPRTGALPDGDTARKFVTTSREGKSVGVADPHTTEIFIAPLQKSMTSRKCAAYCIKGFFIINQKANEIS